MKEGLQRCQLLDAALRTTDDQWHHFVSGLERVLRAVSEVSLPVAAEFRLDDLEIEVITLRGSLRALSHFRCRDAQNMR
uniref:Uncharacterized protein n=1 Tax=Paraburkholderia sprentiae WSM5005 TaxID=754502 RepID=A0A1I9YS63_9BURK